MDESKPGPNYNGLPMVTLLKTDAEDGVQVVNSRELMHTCIYMGVWGASREQMHTCSI